MAKRRITILVILGVVGILGFLIYRRTTAPKKLSIHKVKVEEFTESVVLDGTLVSEDDSDLAFETGGRVVWIGVKEGEKVRKGQAVAQLDTRALKEDLNTALNNAYTAQSEVFEFEEIHEDDRDDPDVIHAKDQLEKAKVNADVAAEKARVTLSKATLIASADGTVVSVNKKVGEYTAFGESVVELSNKGNFKFEAELDEDDLSKVEVGDSAVLELDAFSDLKISAKLENILPKVVQNASAEDIVNVNFLLLEEATSSANLISGLSGEAEIVLESRSGLGIPFEALVTKNGSEHVFVVEGNIIKKKEVKIGSDFGNFTEILSGLNEGDVIVTENVSDLKDGQKIEPNTR